MASHQLCNRSFIQWRFYRNLCFSGTVLILVGLIYSGVHKTVIPRKYSNWVIERNSSGKAYSTMPQSESGTLPEEAEEEDAGDILRDGDASGDILRDGDARTNFRNKTVCPEYPPGLVGSLNVRSNMTPDDLPLLQEYRKHVEPGGRFWPPDCTPRHWTAIILPYRYRTAQLQIVLSHLHTVLQRQKIAYGIYVVEEAPGFRFNRGLASNIGYHVASRTSNYSCYIFHDVDHLMMNDKNIYRCSESPRRVAAVNSKEHFKRPYPTFFGGVQALTKDQFLRVNGFTNLIFGWGGEDDDIEARIRRARMRIETPPDSVGAFMTLNHARDPHYQPNPYKGVVHINSQKNMQKDGINKLKYELLKEELRPLYTWLYISVNQTELLMKYKDVLGDKFANLPTS